MTDQPPARTRSPRWFAAYHATPLYWRILIALAIGVVAGILLGERAQVLELGSGIILRLLGALAPPLILVAVVNVLMNSDIPQGAAGRLARLLLLNTTVAILIGLLVANLLRPGEWAGEGVRPPGQDQAEERSGIIDVVVNNVPRSLFGPLGDGGSVIGVIIIAISFGIALRRFRERPVASVADLVRVAYDAILVVLHWVIDLVPIGVFCIVASVVGVQGFAPFKALGGFIITVLLALLLQTCWYMLRIRWCSWVRPWDVLKGMRDALLMAFSTDSSTVTMPVTFACLRQKIRLRERSASLGSLVGANFNNDGTALYEATAALFVAQLIGQHLSFGDQVMVVLTSILASVGAAGIPEAGLVTMTLVFRQVGLPIEYIALLVTVDWFLDRCRTVVNVLGDVNVSCLLDGHSPEVLAPAEPQVLPDATTADPAPDV